MEQKLVVSITDFGAEPSESLQTEKIQAAIDKCFQNGGGEVQVPAGVFKTGSIRLRSHVTLHLMADAVLQGSNNPEDYMYHLTDTLEPLTEDGDDAFWIKMAKSRWNNGLIRAIRAEDIAIIGEQGAIIDGVDCFDSQGEEGFRGPHAINMFCCKNVVFKRYTIKDSANWAHCIFATDNITADNLTVLAGHDGFHIRACNNTTINNCRFITGDDCIAGFADINVLVQNCELNTSCSFVRLGGTNVLVENCKMVSPSVYGHRYTMNREEQSKSLPTNASHRHSTLGCLTYLCVDGFPMPAQPGNMIIKNCEVTNPDRFYQMNFSGTDKWQKGSPLKNVRFENMVVKGVSMPIVAFSDNTMDTVLEMINVDFSFREGFESIDFIQAGNFERITLQNVNIRNAKGDTLIRTWSDGKIELENVTCDIPEAQRVKKATEPFLSDDV